LTVEKNVLAVTGPEVARQVRSALTRNGGRVATMLVPLPDGTMHLEPGLSQKSEFAARFMAAAIAHGSVQDMPKLAVQSVDAAKALLDALLADGEKAAAERAAAEKGGAS
jgi:hypothetical protein